MCCSWDLSSAEINYSTLERKALTIAWCLQKARLSLLECPDLTDHRPLAKIFKSKELKDISNPRLQNLKKKTLMYSFRMIYLRGKPNCAAPSQ